MRKVLYILGILNDEDVEWMLKYGEHRTIPPETTIVVENESTDYLYIIIEGEFSVRISAMDNKVVSHIRAGEIVGEVSFVDDYPPSATVRSDEESIVLAIPRDDLQAKIGNDSAFASRFYQAVALFLASRLRIAEQRTRVGQNPDDIADNELNLDMLENVSRGGQRFNEILKRLRNR